LGDDMTATLRLWLEEGEQPTAPLAMAIYDDRLQAKADQSPLEITYSASRPTGAPHHDTDPPSRLTDGVWGNPAGQSVQYNDDVALDADLGAVREVGEVRIVVYYRGEASSAGSGFNVQSVAVAVSDDGQSWEQVAELEGQSGPGCYVLSAPVEAAARYVRFDVKKPPQFDRMLLGQIQVFGTEADQQDPAGPARPPRPLHVKKTLERRCWTPASRSSLAATRPTCCATPPALPQALSWPTGPAARRCWPARSSTRPTAAR
jgi:hypothetical protein